MGGDRERMRDIFDQARRLHKPERAAFLDRLGPADAQLRAQLEDMLLALDEAGPFLSEPTRATAGATAAATLAAPLREGPGTRIGPYKLLQLIGEGGFGSVFLAEQEKPVSRKVALKIIKLGMDTRAVIARFEAERQALAMMDHPNIAKVFDAGATETGRPYFVMELCKGETIVEYCDRNSLSIQDRLELFAQVCTAVQHAHTKGIIHRDIKPSNILVSTQDGRPSAKVIDFGIAKATASKLTEKTLFTEHRQLIGTPEYMSPEQAEGSLDIDTRTDVYSLGVLLYELLTGTTPFSSQELRSAAYAEIQRIIREVEPPRPSTRLSHNTDTLASVAAHRHTEPKRLGTIVRGELDWIVMKALEKDRARRYETASGLAMDIGRYLSGEAVLAAPPSTVYRVRKFVRRHRAQAAAAGLVAAALLLGLAGTAWQAMVASERAEAAKQAEDRASAARDAEKARADELLQVSDFQKQMLKQVNAATAGRRLTEDVIRRFSVALEKANVPEAERAGRADAFRAEWERVNATDAAIALIDETILKPAVKAIDEQFQDQPVVDAQLRQALADRYRDLGLYDSAHPLQMSALETRRRVLGEEHPDTLYSISCAGSLLQNQGKLAEAEVYLREALEKSRRIRGEDNSNTLSDIGNLGFLLAQQGKYAEAEPYFREVVERTRRVRGEEHPGTLTVLNNMGSLLRTQGKYAEAEPYLREAVEKGRTVLGEQHGLTLAFMANLGDTLMAQGKTDQAEPYVREALDGRRRVLGEDHPATVTSINNMGRLLQAQGKFTEAEPYLREALEKRRRVLGEEHADTIQSINNMGGLLRSEGRLAEAEPYIRDALEKSRRLLGAEHPGTLASISNMGALLSAQGKPAEAEPYFREGMEKYSRVLGEAHPQTLSITNDLGGVLQVQGKHTEAEAVFAAGVGACRRALTAPDPTIAMLLHHHAEALLSLGRLDDALPEARQAADMYREHPDWPANEAGHALSILLGILTAQGHPDEALAARREWLAAQRQYLPPGSADLANEIRLFAEDLLNRGTLEAAREAEPLFRECLEIRTKAIPDSWLVSTARSMLGETILTSVDLDPQLTPEARADRLGEAEPLLLEGYAGLKDNSDVPALAQMGGVDRRREAVERVVHLYEVWAQAEPGKGYDAKAADWRAKLDAPPATSDQK